MPKQQRRNRKIGTICANNDISLASIVQRCVSDDNTADITVITELVKEKICKMQLNKLNKMEIL